MCYIDYSRLSPSDRPDTQDCVRRRAVLSVQSNPACPDREAAVKAVNEVWESCSNDTRPFDEVSCPFSSGLLLQTKLLFRACRFTDQTPIIYLPLIID